MMDDEFTIILITLIVIIVGCFAISPKLEKNRTERLELMRKYPECSQATYPIKCVRYKREIERFGL